jgi:trimeric autotransporter adhesin
MLLAMLTATTLTLEVSAQAIFSNAITGSNPGASNPFTSGQIVDANLTVSGIGRSGGITTSSAIDRYSATGWNSTSFDGNDYFSWTLTPGSGFQLDLVSLVYSGQASGTGPTTFAFRSSLDSFSANIGAPSATGTTISLSNASFQNLTTPVEFRLYGWNASSATGTFSVNDFTFNGSVSAIPEPSTYAALFGVLSLGLAVARKHRGRLIRVPVNAATGGDLRQTERGA